MTGIVHRGDATKTTQISMFKTIYVADKEVAVTRSIIPTWGGGASEQTRDALRDAVTSISVGRMRP